MQLLRKAGELNRSSGSVCVAMGFFDGLHLGHQRVIRQTLADAREVGSTSLVITFDRHPSTVVAPHRVPPLIYPLAKRLALLESTGVDALLLIHFDKPFSHTTAEDFIGGLHADLPPLRSICVGANFTFGYQKKGNLQVLQHLAARFHFTLHGLPALALEGQPVSSTRIRQAISSGALDLASQMLGRNYSLAGSVVKGDGIGRKLGFPTANLDVSGLVLPPTGVYAVRTVVEGREHGGVLNIGYRPTLRNPAPQLQVEAHLLDFSADLYGQEIDLVLVGKLRDEQQFGSMDELHRQIGRDIEAARLRF